METVLRVAIMYVFLWACFRSIGKRELTKMAPFELVTLLFIPQLFSRALTRQDYSLTNAIIGASTLLLLVFLTSVLGHRSVIAGHIFRARPTVLVSHGQYIEDHMNTERITPEDVFSAMHRVGILQLEDVQYAILQPNGWIAVVPFARASSSASHLPRA